MKEKFGIFIACLGIAISSQAFSQAFEPCGCGPNDSYYWSHPCDRKPCPRQYCSSCECTDYGYRFNTCMSKSKYCEAFGNVGAR